MKICVPIRLESKALIKPGKHVFRYLLRFLSFFFLSTTILHNLPLKRLQNTISWLRYFKLFNLKVYLMPLVYGYIASSDSVVPISQTAKISNGHGMGSSRARFKWKAKPEVKGLHATGRGRRD
jgi:hypothetical protein